ncbi:Protein of unknown function [Cotesia congregata]|uniref:Uncharacterized protein n=1 Tax=Cotesia congregata TaxID=51543 RepID=A0A8J2HG55_COTCN|nr:Protein of unknown function [Cotesia congregata]
MTEQKTIFGMDRVHDNVVITDSNGQQTFVRFYKTLPEEVVILLPNFFQNPGDGVVSDSGVVDSGTVSRGAALRAENFSEATSRISQGSLP